MTVDDVLREIKGKVRGIIPPSIDVSDVEFEGALVVIYTKDGDHEY
jgi:predicted metal-dependent RNase